MQGIYKKRGSPYSYPDKSMSVGIQKHIPNSRSQSRFDKRTGLGRHNDRVRRFYGSSGRFAAHLSNLYSQSPIKAIILLNGPSKTMLSRYKTAYNIDKKNLWQKKKKKYIYIYIYI